MTVKCSICKHKDVSSDPKHPFKHTGTRIAISVAIVLGRVATRKSLELTVMPSIEFWLRERPCLKVNKQGGER